MDEEKAIETEGDTVEDVKPDPSEIKLLLEKLDVIAGKLEAIAEQTKRPERTPLPGKVTGESAPRRRSMFDM